MRLIANLIFVGLAASLALAQAASVSAATVSDEKGPARRAYRAECVKYEPQGYCECVTAGFAQDLSIQQLTLARLNVRFQHASSPVARRGAASEMARTMPDPDQRRSTLTRIGGLETELQESCATP